MQVLTSSPENPKKGTDLAKENTAAKTHWREESKKPWKPSIPLAKSSLNLEVQPKDFKANDKGAMMVFSPG
jgi:hypothetical protein